MDDKSLYAAILGVKEPWAVEKVDLRLTQGEVHVLVALPPKTLWVCPDCRLYSAVYVRRRAFAVTCTSSATTATSPRASMGSSPLALRSNFGGGDCLSHPGTEGRAATIAPGGMLAEAAEGL